MIYLDLHGVLSDFVLGACNEHERFYTPETFTNYNFYEDWGLTPVEFWNKLTGKSFWENLPIYPYASDFYQALLELDQVRICTAPAPCEESYLGTINWLKKELGVSLLM